MKKLLKKYGTLTLLFLVLIALITTFVVARRTIWKPKVTKNYQRFYLDNQQTQYTINKDFFMSSELSVTPKAQNLVLKSDYTFQLSKITDVATKLGLGKLSSNDIRKISLWSTDPFNDKKYIKLDQINGKLDIRYSTGITTEKIDPDKIFDYVNDFLGISPMQSSIIRQTKSANLNIISFKTTYDGKTIFGPPTSDASMTVTTTDGLITGVETYLLMPEYKEKGELKPITKISQSNLASTNYSIEVLPDRITSTGPLGSEIASVPQFDINVKSQKDIYYYYFDQIENTSFLLPAIQLEGNYIDRKNNSGSFILVVINQQYDPAVK